MRASAVLLFATLFACNKKGADQAAKAPPPAPVPVTLATAAPGAAPKVLTLTGAIKADQRAEVTSDTQGKVIAVMIERGQRVKMGDPVVRLDVRSAALSAREAAANLAAARAQKNLAEEECKRAQALLDKGAITRSEYDRQMTQCTSALEQVSAAQARTEMIAKAVADGLVRAPFDGVVADKMVTPGEWVAPGRPLFTLVDDDPLKVELSVPEKAVKDVALGQAVNLTSVATPCTTYKGAVTRVGAEIGRTRAMIVEATIDKTFRGVAELPGCAAEEAGAGLALVPGMFVEAEIVTGSVTRPIVPSTALFQRGKQMHVYVAHDGELQDRIVSRGPSPEPGKVSIVQGLDVAPDAPPLQVLADVAGTAKTLKEQGRELADGLPITGGGASPAKAAAPAAAPAATTPTAGSASK